MHPVRLFEIFTCTSLFMTMLNACTDQVILPANVPSSSPSAESQPEVPRADTIPGMQLSDSTDQMQTPSNDAENNGNDTPTESYTYAPGQMGLRRLTGWNIAMLLEIY